MPDNHTVFIEKPTPLHLETSLPPMLWGDWGG